MMKATGIVRHIDDLGRIVLPKETRREFGIANNDPVEIFTEGSTIVLRKYDPVPALESHLDIVKDLATEHMGKNRPEVLKKIDELKKLIESNN